MPVFCFDTGCIAIPYCNDPSVPGTGDVPAKVILDG